MTNQLDAKVDIFMGGDALAEVDGGPDPRQTARALVRWAESQTDENLAAEAHVWEAGRITYCVMNHPNELGPADYPLEVSYVVPPKPRTQRYHVNVQAAFERDLYIDAGSADEAEQIAEKRAMTEPHFWNGKDWGVAENNDTSYFIEESWGGSHE